MNQTLVSFDRKSQILNYFLNKIEQQGGSLKSLKWQKHSKNLERKFHKLFRILHAHVPAVIRTH